MTQTATPSAAQARQSSASRRPRLRQTYASAGGTITAGKIFAAKPTPSAAKPQRCRPASTAASPPTASAVGQRS